MKSISALPPGRFLLAALSYLPEAVEPFVDLPQVCPPQRMLLSRLALRAHDLRVQLEEPALIGLHPIQRRDQHRNEPRCREPADVFVHHLRRTRSRTFTTQRSTRWIITPPPSGRTIESPSAMRPFMRHARYVRLMAERTSSSSVGAPNETHDRTKDVEELHRDSGAPAARDRQRREDQTKRPSLPPKS